MNEHKRKKWIITSLNKRYLVFSDPYRPDRAVWSRDKWRATRFNSEEVADYATRLYVIHFNGGVMPVKMEIWE